MSGYGPKSRVADPSGSCARIDEAELDLRMVVARLEAAAIELGLLDTEVARILGLPESAWPMPIADHWAPMLGGLERRLRKLCEFCRLAPALMGTDATSWIRRWNDGVGASPLRFMMTEPDGVDALCRVLRDELRQDGDRSRWDRRARPAAMLEDKHDCR